MAEDQAQVEQLCREFRATFTKLKEEIGKVIVGHERIVEDVLIALFSGGHVLLEGVPGLGKTLLVRTLSSALSLTFGRIQFTPDLMPADIIGTNIVMEDKATGARHFQFQRGPIFGQIILADEINRATPKTQSAMLEAMQEHAVTSSGHRYALKEPFFVMATQNPIEQEGTYPLPEAQQDRFMFNVMMDYLGEDDEVTVVKESTGTGSVELTPQVGRDELLAFQELILTVDVPAALVEYTVDLASSSRPENDTSPDFVKEYVVWGAGVRASQFITLGAKSRAAMSGRTTVKAEDIQAVVAPVMRHRIGLSFRSDVDKVTVEDVIERLVDNMPAPAAS